jgi:N-hydroxyarylamine O-acetyltransferase
MPNSNTSGRYDSVVRIQDYLRRIGVAGDAAAPADELLRRLHLAHRETFLFENLTIQTGGRISLRLDDLERKFLDEGRGGYCFEQNTLFAAALRDVGLQPVVLLGRVRRGPPEGWTRTHMVLSVVAGGKTWLADVGFGGMSLLEPLPLREGAEAEQGGLTYWLRREPHVWVLAMRDRAGTAMDLYEFSEEPQTPHDIEVANHFTSTHPDSTFRRALTIQRASRRERLMLSTGKLVAYRDGRSREEAVERDRLHSVVQAAFGLDLPPGPFVCDVTADDSGAAWFSARQRR